MKNQTAEDLKEFKSKVMSSILGKVVTSLLSIITGCVMIIVGFIWNLRSEFSSAKEQTREIQQNIVDIKSVQSEQARGIQQMNETVIRMDGRLIRVEEKVNEKKN